jgi:radical SAM protein with 4Fe4S-binding SPASM domain
MNYKTYSAVWEITMGCNMRCKHCGSSCEETFPDELTTEEALNLCDDLGKLGFKHITLSGGEPTIRKDWNLIAERLNKNGIIPNLITNGWLIDENIIEKAIKSKINTIAISIDGIKETHDFMRKQGSFLRSMHALDLMKQYNIKHMVITTINKRNINELNILREMLIEKGVKCWQLQIGLPMGNLSKNSDLVVEPEQIDDIIDFAYNNLKDERIKIYFADCIGYYNEKELQVKKHSYNDSCMWHGCKAGKAQIGILYNGDIVGCTSMRDKKLIVGNIRTTPIKELWNNPNSFKWNREMKKSDLKGFCSKCIYGSYCLGGCTNTRLCTQKSIYSENKYCSYSIHIKKIKKEIENISDIDILYTKAKELLEIKQYQIAELLLERILKLDNENIDALSLYGYVNFMLENYELSRNINEAIIKKNPENVRILKVLGLSYIRLGDFENGLIHLKKAIQYTNTDYMEPYYDTALVLIEYNKKNEAIDLLNEAREKSLTFYNKNIDLYKELKICLS